MKRLRILFAAFVITALIASCGKEENGLSVEDYIAQENLTTKELDEGVHIVVDNPGNEVRPTLDTKFTIKYNGYLTDSTVFDSNSNGFTGLLRNMIRGWQIGIRELGEGGKAKLIIPSTAGYGNRSTGSIPPNSTLVFDVEIVDYE